MSGKQPEISTDGFHPFPAFQQVPLIRQSPRTARVPEFPERRA
jgi:hypothetical protein